MKILFIPAQILLLEIYSCLFDLLPTQLYLTYDATVHNYKIDHFH